MRILSHGDYGAPEAKSRALILGSSHGNGIEQAAPPGIA